MDNTFKISRFGKYFVYDLKRQWKNIGMLMLIFALSPVIFYMLYMFFAALFDGGLMKLFSGMSIDGPSIWVRFGMAAVMITIFVMLFPSRAYGEITNKAKGAEWLMLPASRLEKFTSMMLISLIVIPLVYVVVYFLSDAFVCLLDKSCGDSLMSFRINKEIGSSDFVIPANGFWLLASGLHHCGKRDRVPARRLDLQEMEGCGHRACALCASNGVFRPVKRLHHQR